MSRDSGSGMSSAVSISGAESCSDDESDIVIEKNKTRLATEFSGNKFDLEDSDLHIIINDITLATHRFLIKRFAGLKDRIKNNAITLELGEPGVETFENTFKILYASVIEGPFDFDPTTLESALLLATRYSYPALRVFAATNLEKAELSAVERIRLAREFDIPLWEEPAYLELCERNEAITMSEAEVLGLETVVHVARIREERQKKEKEVDVVGELKVGLEKDGTDDPEIIDTPDLPAKTVTMASAVTSSQPDKTNDTETKTASETTYQPCFVDFLPPSPQESQSFHHCAPTSCHKIEIDLPGCECSVSNSLGTATVCRYKFPPCVIYAFKNFQTQQLSNINDILELKNAVEQIQVTITAPKLTTEHTTENAPTPSRRSGTAQDNVQNWLAGNEAIVSDTPEETAQVQTQAVEKELEAQGEIVEFPDISSEYSSSEDENRNKEFPEWTRSDNLNQAWRDQERLNPSTIFGPTQPVRMVDLFNTGHPRFSKRTSSVKSSGTDMVGITVEENEYAHRMGYTN